mgnify:CR=1 FL=1
MDDKAKKVFSDKLSGFEAPVADDLWAPIDAGINGGKVPLFFKRWKWAVILLFLAISYGIGYWLYDGKTEQANDDLEQKQVEEKAINPTKSPGERQIEPSRTDESVNGVNSTPLLEEVPSKVKVSTSSAAKVLTDDISRSDLESIVFTPENDANQDMAREVTSGLEIYKLLELKFSPSYFELENPIFTKPFLEIPISKPIDESSKWVSFKWHVALTFNYLNITPNTQDEVFFNPLSSGVNFSLDRIGIRPGIEMSIPINDKLSFKNDLLVSFRRYSIAFDYINDASQTENAFERFANTYSQVSVGLSTGLSYQFTMLNQRKMDFDLGISLEQLISDQLKDERLLDSPNQLFSLNIGLSLYPKNEEKRRRNHES